MEINKCKKCLHEWVSRIDNPRQCPRCKSYSWDEVNIKETNQNDE